ncbi:uncharacterized protein LOC134785631 isoform X2 [Penaeus indicus]|uniref:uncharacterized protein LOC134785631 isoform X2 n=1 Tax=Penaeus indicus TaxID=29960 RepID=UPI00300CD024
MSDITDIEDTQRMPKKPRVDGGNRCAAWGCGTSKLKDGVGVFNFPDEKKSPELLKYWCRLVRNTRSDFKFIKGTSRLCANPSDSDQIENHLFMKLMAEKDPSIAKKTRRLVPKATPNPDLFPKRSTHGTPLMTDTTVRPSRPRIRNRQRPGAAGLWMLPSKKQMQMQTQTWQSWTLCPRRRSLPRPHLCQS